MFEKLSKTLSKRVGKEMEKEEDKDKEKTDQEKAEDDSQLVFDVPSWSLRAMQARQGERNAHLQVQKGATSLSTPQSQAIQNTLRKRLVVGWQSIWLSSMFIQDSSFSSDTRCSLDSTPSLLRSLMQQDAAHLSLSLSFSLTHIQTHTTPLLTPTRRSLMQQQEILAHAISGAVKAVILADGKGAEGKDGAGDQSTKGNNSEGSPATHNSASLPPVSSMKPAMKKCVCVCSHVCCVLCVRVSLCAVSPATHNSCCFSDVVLAHECFMTFS